MPIEGFPDNKRHKFCLRCHQWFEPEDGNMVLPWAGGPVGLLRNAVAHLSDDESMLRFLCHRCQRARHVSRVAIGLILLLALGIALILAWFRR